ncbi:MAG: sigma-54 dependent transcriptional regulator [Myxococcota bacterium]
MELLLVDDEPSIRLALGDALRRAGHKVTVAADGAEGAALIGTKAFDVVVTDIRMPKVDGLSLFRKVRKDAPDTEVILITAYGAVSDAVQALKEGASDYLTKPFDTDEILIRIQRLAERRSLQRELASVHRELEKRRGTIIGHSPVMMRVLERIETIAESDAPVLITGESGTGKELVARRIHELSPRRDKPFIAVNCAAFPETLLEAELFGHERGAFTGAVKKREGRFRSAAGGTLFLDEIAEIPPQAQAKLLRVLQEGMIEPLGSDSAVEVDVRILSATHQNLKTRIADKRFREDLYYRLNVLDVALPPLRERRGDLPGLVEHFARQSQRGKEGPLPSFSPEAWAALSDYGFPGNVRELQHAVERAVVLSRGAEITLGHLPEDISGRSATVQAVSDQRDGLRPLNTAIREFEKEYIMRALDAAGGKKAKAAEILGISRKNLWEKLRGFGVSDAPEAE